MGQTVERIRDAARLEEMLDSFSSSEREKALRALHREVQEGRAALPPAADKVNLHYHTIFSYNACGYSPSKLVWLARKHALRAAGIVDFDVLDGLDEFREAGRLFALRTCAGMETRVYLPEFADAVMNSPGEPGISYHMGVGFPSSKLDGSLPRFLDRLRRTSRDRNRNLVERINTYLDPVLLDYDRDVLPLTPSGNATERHICLAYTRKARSVFGSEDELAAFWSGTLDADPESLDLPEGISLQSLIRSKTIKRGGVGYVQPDGGSFPGMAETNEFVLAAGAIPTYAWLDGCTEGESRIEELLEVVIRGGVLAINIIPARNYTPGKPDRKLENLRRVVALAEELDLLVVAGTEMNSPGQPFVDDFESAELAPMVGTFLKGAYVVYAHSLLQRSSSMGYTSAWAERHFPRRRERIAFFQEVGSRVEPSRAGDLAGLDEAVSPGAVLEKLPR